MIASARLLFRTSRVAAARSTKLLACRYADILDPYPLTSYEKRLFHRDEKRRSALDGEAEDASRGIPEHKEESNIPQRIRQKVISAQDAVSLVRSGDTVVVSGFVCQGTPEAILKSLGERFKETGEPSNLTLLFGGGPGDWDTRGLNHLAQRAPEGSNRPNMLRRTIGSHYGQTPMVAQMAIDEVVEAWTLPLGSISRMIRAQSTHSPGHITDVGIGTYVDPALSGGAANEAAKKSPFHKELVTRVSINGQEQLMYKSIPVDVAIIRGTTADGLGNISLEHESLYCDQKITAAAARNSGGIVIAQVKRLAAIGSIPCRDVAVPGPLVDCVVVVEDEDHDTLHPMSFVERDNPVLTGQVRSPSDELPKMPLSIRKVIARRSFFVLRPNTVVNLGIGLPEGVASVAFEEGMLDYVTLSTEPGVFGGLPASGHSFGPSANAHALVEMNQMFDYYDGGGLDACFLGAAQIAPNGDVNVSRMSMDRLTGPGGFIDISQSTKNITFMTTLTTKGLEVDMPGDGTIKIKQEGRTKKFVNKIFEKTFSGDEAVRRGQTVYYVTERAVFRRTARHETIELVEIAPGIDLKKDVLDQLEFEPFVSPDLKKMDPRIFRESKMESRTDLFGTLEERCVYHEDDHTLFAELFGITIDSDEDLRWFVDSWRSIIQPLYETKGRIDIVVNYDGFDIRKGMEEKWAKEISFFQQNYYKTVQRYAGKAFKRAQLGSQLAISDWDADSLFSTFDVNNDGVVTVEELRDMIMQDFHINMTVNQLHKIVEKHGNELDSKAFEEVVTEIFKSNSA